MAVVDEHVSELERLHRALIETVRECPDERWREPTQAEGWAVGMVAKHIGLGYLQGRAWLRTMAAGEPVTTALDDIHAANSQNRNQEPDSREATVEFLDRCYSKWVETVRGLSDAQLERSVHFGPAAGDARVSDIVALTPRHTRGHLQSIRSTLSPAAV